MAEKCMNTKHHIPFRFPMRIILGFNLFAVLSAVLLFEHYLELIRTWHSYSNSMKKFVRWTSSRSRGAARKLDKLTNIHVWLQNYGEKDSWIFHFMEALAGIKIRHKKNISLVWIMMIIWIVYKCVFYLVLKKQLGERLRASNLDMIMQNNIKQIVSSLGDGTFDESWNGKSSKFSHNTC